MLLTLEIGLPRLREAFIQSRLLIQASNRPMLLAYRYGGKVCAIGAMIPDVLYGLNFEGLSLNGLQVRGLVQIPANELRTLASLQAAHDTGDLASFTQFMNAILEENGHAPV